MFSSGWGQQNQQQQQQQPQQPTGAFGQPTGFGNTTNNAFGSTSAFSQPQQQQPQPQVNPMFGNIGAPSTSTFGGTSNNAATTSAFGVKPATGFGAFSSGTNAFGGGTTTTGAFGQPVNNQPSTSTSVFGQPANASTSSAFGTFNKTFGGTPTTTTTTTPPVVTTGSLAPPYNVTTEKDQNVTLQFNSISCMPQYAGYSAEELRVQDYAQGRKTATATTGAFGQPTAFGATQTTNTGLFGAQPAQPAQPAAPSLFGGTNTTNTNANTAFGAFGQPLNQPTTNTGNLFGGGAFGQPQQQQQPQQQPSAFGGGGSTFGQPQQQQTSAFGGGTSIFGNNAPKPAFTPFGGGGGGTTNVFGSTPSAFGNTQPQQNQPSQNASAFGNTQPANNPSAFGAFGASTLKPSIFGTQTNTTQPNNPTFGTFGNSQLQQNQPNQQPSLFGNNTLFGNQPQQPQNQQGTQPNPLFGGAQNAAPLFGATANTGNIFGNNQQGQQPQQQQGQQQGANTFGNLFGKPAQTNTPLFGQGQSQGNTNQTQQNPNPLFGSTFGQSTQQNPLFGNKPAAPMVNNSFSGSQGMSTGMFGASVNVPGAQGAMTASISQPIGENLPIFTLLPPGPRIVSLEQNSPKKKGGFFVDVPTRSPIPRVLGYTPANSKLRGYGSSLSSSTATGNMLNGSMSLIAGKPNALALTKTDSRASSLVPDGFLSRSGSPALGSGGRESVKKVILDKKIEPTEFFVKSGSPGTLRSGKITFSPALGIASRERDVIQASTPQAQHLESPTPVPRTNRSPNRFTAQNIKEITLLEGDEQPTSTELKKGDYWVKPDLHTLKKSGHDQLSACVGLVVGRKGYGEIHFLEPVDLTGLPKLGALLGEVIKFDDKECSVYPDSEEVDKPPPGSGLNVKAKLSLEGCWAVDKATREPITDPNHPSVVKHLKRLKNMKDTHFDSFDMKTGTWTFTVDHF